MDLKQAHAELQQLAQEIARVPTDDALGLSGRLLTSSMHLAEQVPEEEGDGEDAAVTYLDTSAEKLGKRAWWVPPRNFAINQALMGYNFWQFTILPYFPKQKAYREDLAGIVIHPIWRPVESAPDLLRTLDMDRAKKLVAYARQAMTIQETVRKELAWMETTFSIRIPEAVQSKLLKDSLATAKRRWGVDRLRVKDRLVPLDGSAPRDLGAWA